MNNWLMQCWGDVNIVNIIKSYQPAIAFKQTLDEQVKTSVTILKAIQAYKAAL